MVDKRGDLIAPSKEIGVSGDQHGGARPLRDVGEGRIDLRLVAGAKYAQFAPELVRRRLGIIRFAFRIRIEGVDDDGQRGSGSRFAQNL